MGYSYLKISGPTNGAYFKSKNAMKSWELLNLFSYYFCLSFSASSLSCFLPVAALFFINSALPIT